MKKTLFTLLFLNSALASAASGLLDGTADYVANTPSATISTCSLNPSQSETADCQSKIDSAVASLKNSGFTILSVSNCKVDYYIARCESGKGVTGYVAFIR